MRRPTVLASSLAASVALVFAGCGAGASSGGDADPAKALPASAVFYLEGVVRPEGDQDENVQDLLSTVMRTDDPGKKITDLIDEGLAEQSKGTTWQKDIEPWLGRRFAMTATDLAGAQPGFVAAIATKDADAAADFVARTAKQEGGEKRTSGGTDYYVDAEDETVTGVAGDFVVLTSTDAGFKRALKTLDGDDSLADAKAFEDARADLPEDRLGAFWIDPQAFGDVAAASSGDESAKGIIDSALKGLKPLTATLLAGEDSATIESRTQMPEKGGNSLLSFTGGLGAPELLKSLPADAWAAVGSADLGKTATGALAQVAGGIGTAALGGQLREQTGLDLQRDVLGWMGDVAVYVTGKSAADVRGAVVISATDEQRVAAALPRIAGAVNQQGVPFEPVSVKGAQQAFSATVPGAPAPVVLARAGDRVVIALGEDTAAQALAPSSTLGDSGLYDRAKEAIDGIDPTFFLDGPTAVALIDEASADDADYATAKPYLEMLDLLAAGSDRDGDAVRSLFTAKVK
jgi:hypothetical protein